jgi:glutamate/tyrosine decarboxylase-like PLP-dependent enzyme
MTIERSILQAGVAAIADWEALWPHVETAEELRVPEARISAILAELASRLQDNYPFFHPSYAGQMLKPPHPVAAAAYAMGMRINPNNHALDGGPATAALEKECISALAKMVGFTDPLGHLSSGGTFANLEALWMGRCLRPEGAIAYSSQSHYTHSRMAQVLGLPGIAIDVDAQGRMAVPALESALAKGGIGTVVVTLGTTGLGALDPLEAVVALKRRYDFQLHVDAAYGGFYRLLADLAMPAVAPSPFKAMGEADSIVIDPHKHGLQPYGCGSVLFRDPSWGRFYRHDSPYTYFTSNALHLGEISLECSRSGAAAAAFWATLQCFPLEPDAGLGKVLQATRRAALAFAVHLEESAHYRLVMPPELDILAYFPTGAGLGASAISAESDRVFRTLMEASENPVYLAKLVLPRALVESLSPDVVWDIPTLTVLRSCLIKPEHERMVPWLMERLEAVAR